MTTEYKVRAYHPSTGVLLDEFNDFWEAGYYKVVNGRGLGAIVLRGDHPVIPLLEHRSLIEIWRRNQRLGLDWTADFHGLYLAQNRDFTDKETFVMTCPGLNWLLATRFIFWYAGITDRTRFENRSAEFILKTVVNYNCGPGATVFSGRLVDGAIPGFSVETITGIGGGEILTRSFAWGNVLDVLKRIAGQGGGDFNLVATSPTTWEFRWYGGQLGQDRTAELLFSLGMGNMANPKYRYDRREAATVALAAGQGEVDERDVVVVFSPDHTLGNHVETFVDGREVEKGNLPALEDKANGRLEDRKAREEFTFDVLQTPSSAYGVHYGLGDLGKAAWRDVATVQKIVGVGVSVNLRGNAVEKIDVETETV